MSRKWIPLKSAPNPNRLIDTGTLMSSIPHRGPEDTGIRGILGPLYHLYAHTTPRWLYSQDWYAMVSAISQTEYMSKPDAGSVRESVHPRQARREFEFNLDMTRRGILADMVQEQDESSMLPAFIRISCERARRKAEGIPIGNEDDFAFHRFNQEAAREGMRFLIADCEAGHYDAFQRLHDDPPYSPHRRRRVHGYVPAGQPWRTQFEWHGGLPAAVTFSIDLTGERPGRPPAPNPAPREEVEHDLYSMGLAYPIDWTYNIDSDVVTLQPSGVATLLIPEALACAVMLAMIRFPIESVCFWPRDDSRLCWTRTRFRFDAIDRTFADRPELREPDLDLQTCQNSLRYHRLLNTPLFDHCFPRGIETWLRSIGSDLRNLSGTNSALYAGLRQIILSTRSFGTTSLPLRTLRELVRRPLSSPRA